MIANVSQYGCRFGVSHRTNLLPFFDRVTGPQSCIDIYAYTSWSHLTSYRIIFWLKILHRMKSPFLESGAEQKDTGVIANNCKTQALNALWWEKLANATHRCIIKEYEVKEGKWFWINDSYYYALSTSHFHASRKMWNTAGNSKDSYRDDPSAGRQVPKTRLMQAERWLDLCL